MKLKYTRLDTPYISGGMRPKIVESEFDTEAYKQDWNETDVKLCLQEWKTMDQLIKENPNYYFDKYGNFNTGETTDRGYESNSHLAPSFFPYLGKTVHQHYIPADGIPKNTFFYKVIDY